MTDLYETEQGPSWQRPNWPVAALDAVNLGLDPTEATLEQVAAKAKDKAAASGASEAEVRRAAEDSIRAMMLIRTYRVRGHLAADLDPLGLAKRDLPADLTPEYHGFTAADLDRPIFIGGNLGLETATVREIVAILRANYCGKIGLEYMHINDLGERRFLQDRIEGRDKGASFTAEGKQAILEKVIHGEQWEKFLARKYVGTKRFGLDGGESMIPALGSRDQIWRAGGRRGDRRRHGPPRPPQRPRQRDGQALPRDLQRVRGRQRQSRGCRRVGRRQISPRHLVRPRVRRHQGPPLAAGQSRRTSRRSTRSCWARRARCR